MRIVLTTLVLITVIATLVVVSYGCGPVGPESIVGKEVEQLVAKSAARADASVSAAISVNPTLLELPSELERRRRVKRMLAKIGIVYAAPETAMQLTVHEQHGSESVPCLIVLRGDHVIGIAVIEDGENSLFADRLQEALRVEFRGYEVQRLRRELSSSGIPPKWADARLPTRCKTPLQTIEKRGG